ncbi:protein kinase [Streptomyces uncialis]|uniref:serine/threonine-protein kinase n=1 Tax=Streptomyces uncialis TaxID=1048205 RepID=UPI0038225933
MDQVIAGRYELVERIGAGGMGVVWRARDRVLHRDVAVKVIGGLGPGASAVARLEREARAAAGLSRNPHVVTVHDYGRDGDRAYVVMELVEGRTLDKFLAESGLPGPAVAVDWVRQICLALDAAHSVGVVHRDIKPSNVVLGRDGVIQVLDFGLAWFHPDYGLDRLSKSAAVMGSTPWMSPEQAKGESVDHRSDLYSVGCLLYELLTLTSPFGGREPMAQLYAHVSETPPAPSTRQGTETTMAVIPAVLDRLVLHLLAKDPENRPASAARVLMEIDALQDALSGPDEGAASPSQRQPAPSPEPHRAAATDDAENEPRKRLGLNRRRLLILAAGTAAATAAAVPYALQEQGGGADGKPGATPSTSTPARKFTPPRPLWDLPLQEDVANLGMPEAAAGELVMLSIQTGGGPVGYDARDSQTGKLLWTFPPPKDPKDEINLRMYVDPTGSIVCFNLDNGTLIVKDAKTGRTSWTYRIRASKGQSRLGGGYTMAFDGHRAYIADNGRCSGLDFSGDEMWTLTLNDDTSDCALVGQVLMVQGTANQYAVDIDSYVDINSREIIWQRRNPMLLTMGGGVTFLESSENGPVQAVTVGDGTVRWTDTVLPVDIRAKYNLAVFEHGGRLRARALDTGKAVYDRALPPAANNYFETAGDVLVREVREGEDFLHLGISLERGTELWRKKALGKLRTHHQSPPGTVLAVNDSTLTAFDLTTGDARWSVTPDAKRKVLDAGMVGNLLYVVTGQETDPAIGPRRVERLHCLGPSATRW